MMLKALGITLAVALVLIPGSTSLAGQPRPISQGQVVLPICAYTTGDYFDFGKYVVRGSSNPAWFPRGTCIAVPAGLNPGDEVQVSFQFGGLTFTGTLWVGSGAGGSILEVASS